MNSTPFRAQRSYVIIINFCRRGRRPHRKCYINISKGNTGKERDLSLLPTGRVCLNYILSFVFGNRDRSIGLPSDGDSRFGADELRKLGSLKEYNPVSSGIEKFIR